MTTYSTLGGGLTLREEAQDALEAALANSAHYLTGDDFAIQSSEYCSVANLVGLSGTIDGQSLYCATYYENVIYLPFKNGGGFFVWDSTKAKSSHNGVTVISPTVPWTGTQSTLLSFHSGAGETDPSGLGCWVRQTNGTLNVYQAGAVGDGSSDDTAAINACISALSSTGGAVYFPIGTFKITSTITISNSGIYLIGGGWKSIITRSSDFGDTIFFNGNDTTGAVIAECGMVNIKLQATGLMSSGAHLHIRGLVRSVFDKIYTQDGYIDFKLERAGGIKFSNLYALNTNKYGGTLSGRKYFEVVRASGAYANKTTGDIFVSNFNFRGNISDQTLIEYGIDIQVADGIWFSNGHIGNGNVANLRLIRETNDIFNLVYFDNVMFDANPGYGVYFDSTDLSGYMNDIKFSTCTFKGGVNYGTIGIATSSDCMATQVQFDNCSVVEYQQYGVDIQSSNFRNVFFNEAYVAGNSRAGSGLYSGYNFAANTRDIFINGGKSGGHNSNPASASNQSYGMAFSTGHSNIQVSDVNLTGNVTGSYSGGTGIKFSNVLLENGSLYSSTGTSATSSTIDSSGRIGIGSIVTSSVLGSTQALTGAVTFNGITQNGQVKSDVTTSSAGFVNNSQVENAAFTLPTYYGYLAQQGTIGAAATVSTQIGFMAAASLTGANNNFGFRSEIASSSGRWNFYAAGTARNFMAGRLDVAGTARTGSVAPSLTNPTNFYSADSTFTDGNTAASGTVAHVPVNAFNNPALAATNATVTYTNASTVYIDGAPTASTNITITNPYSLYVSSGNSHFGGIVNTTESLTVDGVQVVSNRVTGWTADTGTAKRTANTTYSATASVAYDQTEIQTLMDMVRDQSQTIKALKDDLIAHGLIGS